MFAQKPRSDDGKAILAIPKFRSAFHILNIKLKGEIWLYGGGKLITSLVNLGLIDVYRLAIHPVIIGRGIPLFKDITKRIGLRLIDAKHQNPGSLC